MKVLMEMGHGDEIIFADANYPATANAQRLIRADGHEITDLLESVLKFMPLDNFMKYPVKLMAVVPGTGDTPEIWSKYEDIIKKYDNQNAFTEFEYIERMEFYEKSKDAFAIVTTGTIARYANIVLKMGVL